MQYLWFRLVATCAHERESELANVGYGVVYFGEAAFAVHSCLASASHSTAPMLPLNYQRQGVFCSSPCQCLEPPERRE